MSAKNNQGYRFNHFGRNRGAKLAAAATLVLANMAMATTLYFDNNGASAGFGSGTNTWDESTTADWNTVSGSTTTNAPGKWNASTDFNTAVFQAGFTVNVAGIVNVGGMNFTAGATTITTPAGTTGEALNIGTSTYNTTTLTGGYAITTAVAGREIIAVPIVGSGDLVCTSGQSNNSNTIDFAGNMSQFTGNMYLNDATGFGTGTATGAQYQLDSPTGGTGTIYLDQNVALTSNNQIGSPVGLTESGNNANGVYSGTYGDYSTGALVAATPNVFTISNPIELNYKGAAGTTGNTIGAPNGPTITIGGIATAFQKIITYSGAISSPAGVTSNLIIGGGRGTTILSNSNNSYNGNTYVTVGNNNGLFQIGADNVIPATSQLIMGASSSSTSVGPTDLDGHSIAIAGLSTAFVPAKGSAAANVDGNIYNLTVNNSGFEGGIGYYQNLSANSSTITITPVTTLSNVFYGDIGDTNLEANPFNDNEPYSNGQSGANNAKYVTANTNISLVLNGASDGGKYTLELAPNQGNGSTGLINGNEYSGTTTINNNATLIFGRGYDQQSGSTYSSGPGVGVPSSSYTITGTGAVNVNSGGTISSIPTGTVTTNGITNFYFAGGAAGTITLNSGASMTPGGAGTVGTLSTNNVTFNAGASMTFDVANAGSFDYVFLNGRLNLDDSSNSNHIINIGAVTNGGILPGTYNLIQAYSGISGDNNSYSLGTLPTGSSDIFTLNVGNGGSALQLVVFGSAIQWDPQATGPAITDGGGTWNDGSQFYDFDETAPGSQTAVGDINFSDIPASDEVVFGNNINGQGGEVDLGENITVNGGLVFGAIQSPFPYVLADPSNTYHLNLGAGGLAVHTLTTSGDSADISVPVSLTADQNWQVDSGQFLGVTGAVTGNYTLTTTGAGVIDLESSTGSLAGLTISGAQAGYVLIKNPGTSGGDGTIGAVVLTLDGGGLEFQGNGMFTNSITVTANGGAIGAAAGNLTGPLTDTITANISAPTTPSTSGFEAIGSGALTFTGNITGNFQNAESTTTISGNSVMGSSTLTGTNSFTELKVTGGMLVFANAASFGGYAGTIQLQPSSTTNPAAISFPTSITNLTNDINIGTNGSANMTIINTVPMVLSGKISGNGNLHLTGPEYTISGANTNGNSIDLGTNSTNQIVHATSNGAFGAAPGGSGTTIEVDSSSTLDIPGTVNVTASALRSTLVAATLTKTGTGTLTLSSFPGTPTVAHSVLDITAGNVVMQSAQSIGGTSSSNLDFDIIVESNGTLTADWAGTGSRQTGNITLNSGTLTHPTVLSGTSLTAADDAFVALTAADVITINGNSTISDTADESISPGNIDQNLSIQYPVVVTTGAHLTLNNTNAGGYFGNQAIDFRGPSVANSSTGNDFDTFTIQGGATVTQTGPGEVRFGRVSTTAGNSNGNPIIGTGTAAGLGNDATLQVGVDTYLQDDLSTSPSVYTLLIPNSAPGSPGGLRIEAPMISNYYNPTTTPAVVSGQQSPGTTGLFGPTQTGTVTGTLGGDPYYNVGTKGTYNNQNSPFTVLSPNRAMQLSSTYNNGTSTLTPQGTLTLAANDAGDVTGRIVVGPSAISKVTLGLDNTAGSSGTHIYQIDPASPGGGHFTNFAGLTVERTNAGGAAVTAQLLGTTLVHALTISGGAKVDITNQAMAIDPLTGSAPTAQIRGYLVSAYDHGNWDGTGIGSTSTSAVGTTIGYVENDLLATPFNVTTNLFGGQAVDGNAVLVKYTYMGDLNLDGIVDNSDLAMMGSAQVGWFGGDINYDNTVNADDWSLFMLGAAAYSAHGQITSAVPEPAAVSMLAVGAGMMLRRRRRA